MRILIYLAVIMVFTFGCTKESQNREVITNTKLDSTVNEGKALKTMPALDTAKVDLDSINFITLKEGTYEGQFDLYNLDNTFWKSFELGDTCCGPSLNPYSIKSDYGHLAFRVVGRTNNAYIIVADEKKDIQKLFKPSDPSFNYFPMGEMILNSVFIGFHEGDTATLRSGPSYSEKVLPYNENLRYEPVKIEGEWLKVKDENGLEGWMRWYNSKGEVLINYEIFSLGC